jgi:hypothetical protein
MGVWVVLLALLGVFPFVLLGIYAHPSADDWYMAADSVEKGFWKANLDYYKEATGRFLSSAFLFMNPILFSFGAFKCYSVCLVLGLVASARWAVGAWFPHMSSMWKWAAALSGMTLFLWGMASPAQAFYWGTGSAGYTLPAVMALAIAALTGRQSLELGWKPSAAVLVLSALLAVAATGCTEVAMALLLLHVLALNALVVWRSRRINGPLAVLLLAIVVGAAIVMLAPGNATRSSLYSNGVNHVLPAALALALKLGVRQVGGWLVYLPFLPFSLIALSAWPVARGVSRQRAVELILLAVVLMAGGVFGAFFLGAWSMGAALPLRAVNLMLFFFIIDWCVLLAGIVALLRSLELRMPRPGLLSALGILLLLAAAAFSPGNNVKDAWRDLGGGAALRYDQESSRRHALIRASQEADVLVPPLTARPDTLFFNDLTPDPTNWRNTGCARFFRKHSVALNSTVLPNP